jgi:hypothetical protein
MNLSANDAASCHCRSVDTPRSTPRWPHDMVDVWSAECAHEEQMRCLDHCCYRLGNSAARHELMTISLPSSSQRCRLALVTADLRNTAPLSALSFLNAVFNRAQQPPLVVRNRRLWHTAWTAADVLCSANPTVRRRRRRDAFVTVLTHDSVQPANSRSKRASASRVSSAARDKKRHDSDILRHAH